MIKSILLFAAVLLCGCQTTKFKDSYSEFERTSYFTFSEIRDMTVTIEDEKGNKRTLILSGSSDEVQALEKVAEGVAKGLAAGIKP